MPRGVQVAGRLSHSMARRRPVTAAALFLATLALFSAALVPIAVAATACTCPKGLSGATCSVPAPASPATPTTTYFCRSGYTLAGTTCTLNYVCITTPGHTCPPPAIPAKSTTTYSCPAGYTLAGATCIGPTSHSAVACFGESLVTSGQAAVQASRPGLTAVQTQLESIRDRIQSRSQAQSSPPPLGFAEETEASPAASDFEALGYTDAKPLKALILKAAPKPPEPGVTFSSWMQGFGDYDKFNGEAGGISFGRIAQTGGGIAGIDATIPQFLGGDAFVIGILGSGTSSDVTYSDGSSLQVSGPSVGMYAIFVSGGFSINSVTKVDFFDLSSNSPTGVGTPLGMTNYTTAYNVYYKFQMNNNWWLEPTVGISYNTDVWDSTSAAIGFQNGVDWRGQIGARFGASYDWNGVTVVPTLTALLYDDFIVTGNTLVSAAFGPTTFVPTDEGYIFGQLIGRITFDWGKGFSSYVEAEVRGSGIEWGAAGRVGVRYAFGSP